ncbi:inositol monophosphatase family protein [Salipiger mucosus]|uniref:Monophosphatase-like protein n=1 Tax=Salipiger mucosus DSM 16094 TaxID=1123237 RepID=S9QMY5_9RHOB|nr:inositol monophosphatase [Salipiger mucosus]EPX82826.1 Monophosphatase-like protein [Salipiger mucosus DSM 16094]
MTDSLPMPISTLTKAQRTSILNLVRRAARAEILPRFRSLEASDIAEKTGRQDLVTEADRAAEAMIARGLSRLFPNALIVGEEAVSENPGILDGIPEAEQAFTIDPVDGTWAYANGLTTFGVIVSMLRFGKPVFGLIYDPVMDDCALAASGEPAVLTLPGRQTTREITVSKGAPIEELQGFIQLYNLPKEVQPQVAATLPGFERTMTLRCTAHEFRMFAQGNMDFMLIGRLTPWDHAAGVLIARAAGGHVAMLDGSEYSAEKREGYLLLAPDAATWGRLRDTFSFLLDETGTEAEAETDTPAAG